MGNPFLTKYGRRYLLIGCIATTILMIMGYSFYMGNRMVTRYDPLIDAAMEIKLKATVAHLWFEEILSGDQGETIETVISHIDQSLWYANAMLEGGQNSEGIFYPLEDPLLRGKVTTVIQELNKYKDLTFQRYAAFATSGPGSAIDQAYDRIFKTFNEDTDLIETLLQKKIRSETRLFKILQTLLISIVLLLSGLILILHINFDLRHEKDLAEISKEVEVRKAVEQKLREMNNLKDLFISIAAHEMKAPLTVLYGYSEFLLENSTPSQEIREECLKHIHDKTGALNKLVDEFLDVSRLESGNSIRIEKSPVKISAIARDVLQHHFKETDRYDFQLRFDDEQVVILADSGRLRQLFENLIGNAVKYSPEGGRVEVKGEAGADHYQVTVSDEGIGMSPEQQSQIFEKYYRADPTNNSVKGLGLGLFFVKNIIELHGGRIWVESHPGEGSQFFFTLPLAATETKPSATSPSCAA